MKGLFQRVGSWLRQPELRTILLWCLPALVIGGVLRAVLWARMPHAFYHPDSDQVFITWYGFLHHAVQFHAKKTPLGPLLYCLPPLLRLPVLPTIALAQHLLGLGLVAMIGALVARSFARWRWFIIPITILVAINPVLLWYEHIALPEACYCFSIVATALAGLLFFRTPDRMHGIALGVALFCTAGFRPEGKLFFLFGLALIVATWWRQPRQMRWPVAAMLALAALCFAMNRTGQSGSLLYSNVAQLTPAHLKSAPGFVEAHQAHFDDLRQRWATTPVTSIVKERKVLFVFAQEYLRAKGVAARGKEIDKFCAQIGKEVCLRNAVALPGLALSKFRYALRSATAEDFGPSWCFRRQAAALTRAASEDAEKSREITHGLFKVAYGQDFGEPSEIAPFLRSRYHPFQPDWLTGWQRQYAKAVIGFRMPDRKLLGGKLLGIPWLYLASFLGLLAMAARERSLRAYHLLWFGMLVLIGFVLNLTGSNLGRFRFCFEPFWVLYACGLLDAAIDFALRLRSRKSSGLETGVSIHEVTASG